MWQRLFRFIVIRSAVLFSIFHLGLITSLIGFSLAFEDYHQEAWFKVLGTGLGLVLLSTTLSWWLVLAPIARLALIVRRAIYWRKWILKELPVLLASVPAFIEAIRKIFAKEKQSETSFTTHPTEGSPLAETITEIGSTLSKDNRISKKTNENPKSSKRAA